LFHAGPVPLPLSSPILSLGFVLLVCLATSLFFFSGHSGAHISLSDIPHRV
jgi:hypothetical protein